MNMPAVEALAASKLRKAQLMPNRNRGCALAPWDNCISQQIRRARPEIKPGMHFVRNHRDGPMTCN
jgi:hypothetical protein